MIKKEPCRACGKQVPGYDLVRYGSEADGYQDLCSHCFNATVATTMGMDHVENPEFAPLSLIDNEGIRHTFHFQYRYFGTAVELEAFELDEHGPSGHRFKIYGETNDDPFTLFATLITKIKRTLSIQHLVDGTSGPQIADHGVVRGLIDSDLDSFDRRPLFVIDGRPITLDELGRMLMSFEGWRFKIVLREVDEDDPNPP